MTEQAATPLICIGSLEPDPSAEEVLRRFAHEGDPTERAFLSHAVFRAVERVRDEVLEARRSPASGEDGSEAAPTFLAEVTAWEPIPPWVLHPCAAEGVRGS